MHVCLWRHNTDTAKLTLKALGEEGHAGIKLELALPSHFSLLGKRVDKAWDLAIAAASDTVRLQLQQNPLNPKPLTLKPKPLNP